MIEAIQVAAMNAAQANPAASPAAQPQATMFEVNQFADAYARGGAPASGGPGDVAAPAQPSQGMRALLSTFENLNGGADSINTMSRTMSATANPSPGDMLKMTMECHQFLFKAELTSNVANRTSDGVQQLFKQQS
jgi:Type III secretion basal body protein I, YscI, HrpB, PscI